MHKGRRHRFACLCVIDIACFLMVCGKSCRLDRRKEILRVEININFFVFVLYFARLFVTLRPICLFKTTAST